SAILASRALFVFSIVVATLLFMVRHQTLFFGHLSFVDINTALTYWRSINHPLRLINVAAWAYIAWYMPIWIDQRVHGLLAFRFLRYIGRHSLQVFAWSAVVSYTAASLGGSWASLS